MLQVDRDICSLCGRCVAFCPREALSVTVKWGRLSIDEAECTRCFGGSYSFVDAVDRKAITSLLKSRRGGWNLICTENCPLGALKFTDDGTAD